MGRALISRPSDRVARSRMHATDAALEAEALADLPPDIGSSPLFNADLAPVPPARRTWTTYNFAALWIWHGALHSHLHDRRRPGRQRHELVAGAAHDRPGQPHRAGAHPPQRPPRHQVRHPLSGARPRVASAPAAPTCPAVLRAVVACGWFGIQTWIGGEAVKTFVEALWPQFATLGG